MKSYYLSLLLFLVLTNAFSQDTIMFKTRVAEVARVEEITPSEVSYRRFNNLSGPIFRVEKSLIAYIRLANGIIDSFPPIKKPETVYVPPTLPDKITVSGTDLYLGSRKISESTLLVLSNRLPPGSKQDRMKAQIKEMYRLKTKMYTYFFIGMALTVACPVLAALDEFDEDLGTTGLIVWGSGTALGIAGLSAGKIYQRKKKLKHVEIANIYNE